MRYSTSDSLGAKRSEVSSFFHKHQTNRPMTQWVISSGTNGASLGWDLCLVIVSSLPTTCRRWKQTGKRGAVIQCHCSVSMWYAYASPASQPGGQYKRNVCFDCEVQADCFSKATEPKAFQLLQIKWTRGLVSIYHWHKTCIPQCQSWTKLKKDDKNVLLPQSWNWWGAVTSCIVLSRTAFDFSNWSTNLWRHECNIKMSCI